MHVSMSTTYHETLHDKRAYVRVRQSRRNRQSDLFLTELVSSRSRVSSETATYLAKRVSTTVFVPISLSGSVSWTGLSAMFEQSLRFAGDLSEPR